MRPLPFVDKSQVDLGIVSIAQDQLFVAVVVVACTVALWFLFDGPGSGFRPGRRRGLKGAIMSATTNLVARANWVLSTVITGLLEILVASVNANVDPLVIPRPGHPGADGGAGRRFSSFRWTTLAAFLGMQLPLVQYLRVSADWFPQAEGLPVPGVDTLVPLIVIVLVLFFRGDALPTRGWCGPAGCRGRRARRRGRCAGPAPPFVLASLAAMF